VTAYRVAMFVARPLIGLVFRPRVRGREHLPRGGFVIAANHLSGWDAVAVAYALAPRPVRNMGKNQLFVRPLLGPLVRSLGAYPANDTDELRGGVAAGADAARDGYPVVIFPTGARRRVDKEHRLRTGAAATAIEGGVPLIPAALAGTDGWRRLTRWRVEIGPPVEPLVNARDGTNALAERIAALEAAM
jgi:1-acyl-sn-glycerol-3-phosphate acyltransferase